MMKLQKDFLLSGMSEEVRFHLVNWKVICTPILYGGLRVKKYLVLNQAHLGKWFWCNAYKENALWRKGKDIKFVFWRDGVLKWLQVHME